MSNLPIRSTTIMNFQYRISSLIVRIPALVLVLLVGGHSNSVLADQIEESIPSESASSAEKRPKDFLPVESMLTTGKQLPDESILPPSYHFAATVNRKEQSAEISAQLGDLSLNEDVEKTPWPRMVHDSHTAAVTAIQFSPDAMTMYTAGRDKVVRVWRKVGPAQWQQQDVLRWQTGRGLSGTINALLVTEEYLFIGGYGANAGCEIAVFDRQTLLPIAALIDPIDHDSLAIHALADISSPNQTSIIATDDRQGILKWSLDKTTGKWDFKRLRDISSLRLAQPVSRLSADKFLVSNPSQSMAAPNGTKNVDSTLELQLYNGTSGEIESLLMSTPGSISNEAIFCQLFLSLSRFEQRTLSAEYKQRAVDFLTKFSGTAFTKIVVSPDAKYVATLDNSGLLSAWDHEQQLVLKYIPSNNARFVITDLCFSDQTESFFVIEKNVRLKSYQIVRWDRQADGAFKSEKRSGDLAVEVHAINCRDSTVYVSSGKNITVLDNDLNSIASIGVDQDIPVKSIQWNSDGLPAWRWTDEIDQSLAIGVAIDDKSGQQVRLIDASSRQWFEPNIPSNARLASYLHYDPLRRIWMTSPKNVQASLELPLEKNESAETRYGSLGACCWVFDANGQIVGMAVTFANSPEIRVFDLPDPRTKKCNVVRVFHGHEDETTAMACSPDGRYLVTASKDQMMSVWPLRNINSNDETGVDKIQRWGLKTAINKAALQVLEVQADGPLNSCGLRAGDQISKLGWVQLDHSTKKMVSKSTEVPEEILEKLKSNSAFVDTFEFWHSRRGEAALSFRRNCQWEPLLTVAVSKDRQWAAWSPTGFYDSSVDGDHLFGWQSNHGVGVEPDFFTAASFRAMLERPTVIGTLLNTGDLVKALESSAVNPTGGPDNMLKNYLQLQPKVEILSPRQGEIGEANQTVIRARVQVQREQAVLNPRAFANGVVAKNPTQVGPVRGEIDPADPMKRNFVFEWDAALPSDEQLKFKVMMDTNERKHGVSEIAVRRTAKVPNSSTPKIYAIAVGVSRYRDASLDLSMASDNAKRFAAMFGKSSDGSFANTTLLADEMVTTIAWRSTLQELADRLQMNATPDDLVIIYLSGHGVIDSKNRAYHFVTSQASTQDIRDGRFDDCLDVSDLSVLRDIACRKLVVLDTCHSGAAQSLDASKFKSAIRRLQDDQIFVIAASDGTQLVQENVFSDALFEALLGAADPDQNRKVSLKETLDFVVAQRRSSNAYQLPMIVPSDLAEFIDTYVVQIAAPPQ